MISDDKSFWLALVFGAAWLLFGWFKVLPHLRRQCEVSRRADRLLRQVEEMRKENERFLHREDGDDR